MQDNQWVPPKTLEEKVRDFIVPDWLRIRERAWRERRKGEKGWKGVLHYCTKQMFCKDQFLNVLDTNNSNISVA